MRKILNIIAVLLAITLVTSCSPKENQKIDVENSKKVEDKTSEKKKDDDEYSGKDIIIGLKHKVDTDILYTTIVLKDEKMMPYEVEKDVILYPYGEEMYKFQVAEFNHESVNEDMKDQYDEELGEYPLYAYNHKFNFKDIQFLKKEEEAKSTRTVEGLMPEEGEIANIKFGRDEIMAIGDGFISIKEYTMATGGGSMVYANNTNKIYSIEGLNESKEIKINQVFNGDLDRGILEVMEKNEIKEEEKEEGNSSDKFYFDKENITIVGFEGELVLGLPYVQEFTHTGNGSHFKDMLSYSKIPVELKQGFKRDKLPVEYKELEENIEELREAYYIKEVEAIVVLTKDSLELYMRENREWNKPDKTIPINGDSYIVYVGEA
ncbi:hypothetical protein [Oceanirhabdus sp. W0125-5]|uniref:hypothetical protein n=1 Tax=Oceanirhabdus sp. W0125-5 TaxID=2999116 RepID=UPI0022F308AA|nr:hypothetical protein [Oceanirhabdus sp. W0125-5]WBW98229.1 hypothetical protein OW730_05535 [Oceanirhabdus sp. W0125-5]